LRGATTHQPSLPELVIRQRNCASRGPPSRPQDYRQGDHREVIAATKTGAEGRQDIPAARSCPPPSHRFALVDLPTPGGDANTSRISLSWCCQNPNQILAIITTRGVVSARPHNAVTRESPLVSEDGYSASVPPCRDG
jgi:hypothetical protein